MPYLAQAAVWGLLAGCGPLIGAVIAVAFGGRLSHRINATAMGFAGGVLIAVLSIRSMDPAFRHGSPMAVTLGFLLGATTFCAINWRLVRWGARHRNRCGDCVRQPSEADQRGSGLAIAAGALLDGVPESLVVGLSLLGGEGIGPGLVAGFFLANIPQGLSSSSGMRKAGRSGRYIIGLWTAILLASGIAAVAGCLLLDPAAPAVPATMLAFAAGAVLAMLAESMIPEAFSDSQPFIGLVTVIGFLVAFLIVRMPERTGADDVRPPAGERTIEPGPGPEGAARPQSITQPVPVVNGRNDRMVATTAVVLALTGTGPYSLDALLGIPERPSGSAVDPFHRRRRRDAAAVAWEGGETRARGAPVRAARRGTEKDLRAPDREVRDEPDVLAGNRR